MQYEVLQLNDNGTAKVRLSIGGKTLEQDFACDGLEDNIKLGLAVFKHELSSAQAPAPAAEALVGQVNKVLVADLPAIPVEDFEPEQPVGA